MTITTTFNPPLPSDSPSVFNTKAFTLLGDLNDWSTEANALAVSVNADEAALAAAVSSASSSAGTATTKAADASGFASAASGSAGTATTQAGIATTQAGIATTKAGEANSSAIAAAASAATLNLAAPGPIGATTPAAGSFTTLSATGNVESSGQIRSDGSGARTAITTTGGASNFQLKHSATGPVYILNSGATGVAFRNSADTGDIVLIDNTGLAVTGQISATGDVSAIGNSGSKYFRLNSSGDIDSIRNAKIGKNFDSPWDLAIHASTGTSGSLNEAAIKFYKNNTDVTATLDTSGNLGLGVTPSGWALSGSAAFQVKNASLAGYANTAYLSANAYFNSGGGPNYIASSYATQYVSGNGTHSWHTAPSGTAGDPITFTQALSVGHGTTLALAGATSNTGTGISFPATQNASADANTLDDYEEGTWTPTVAGVTLASSVGAYTKTGRNVHVAFDITWPTTTDATNVTISALPFAAANNSGVMATGYSTYTNAPAGVCGGGGIVLYGLSGNPQSPIANVDMSVKRLIASATYTV